LSGVIIGGGKRRAGRVKETHSKVRKMSPNKKTSEGEPLICKVIIGRPGPDLVVGSEKKMARKVGGKITTIAV